jgi:flagellar biosynthesis/type III secretory pathway chaperone
MVVVDEELARVAESPVIPEAESYVSGKMQSWATRDVANKKAELADEELEVQTQKAERSDKWAAIRANMLSEEWSKITQLENRCQELCRANTYMKDVIKKNEETFEAANTVMKEFKTKYEETLEVSKALLATNNKLLATDKKYEETFEETLEASKVRLATNDKLLAINKKYEEALATLCILLCVLLFVIVDMCTATCNTIT